MSDFKEFLDKVLAPPRGGAQDKAVPAAIILPPEAKPASAVPEDELRRRYVAVASAVFADALDDRALPVLADVLCWELAVIAHCYGSPATADIMQKFGVHLERLGAVEDAQREAENAREEGHKPN